MKTKIILCFLLMTQLTLIHFAENPKNRSGQQTKKKTNPFSQVNFTPSISFILDFSLLSRNLDNEAFQSLEIPGWMSGNGHAHGGEDHGHADPNSQKGFNLNYGELVLSAAVDPYFDMFTTFHLTENSFEIEEAYISTRSLPWGLTLKMGKFLSGFGRLNAQHAHYWDFADIPLVYRSIFGSEGLAEIGAQLNWVAPTDFYLSFGIESLQGTNEGSFGTDGFHLVDAETEEELEVDEPALPNVWTLYGRTSIEFGDFILLAGASYAFGENRQNMLEAEEPFALSGDSDVTGFYVTAKYILDSYRSLTFQAEYIHRKMQGVFYESHNGHEEELHDGEIDQEENGHHHDAVEVETLEMTKAQGGLYAQLIFRFERRWRLGARWDILHKNDIIQEGITQNLPENLNRTSFMLDYSPTEFSRIRLQYNLNRYAYYEGTRKNYSEILLQFNLAMGAHGAHPF